MIESRGDVRPIPVLRPQLPDAAKLLPYLQRIDTARIYTNWGPLACEFESRLARTLSLPQGGVVSASSGTSALVGAILAAAGRAGPRPLALMPGFTFVATATAAQVCGYQPYLTDISADSLTLDPNDVLRCPALTQVGVVIPVATFGRPVPQAPWNDFRVRTGIPVVIDGAASFDGLARSPAQYLGDIPVTLSFHATKSFATGEGGGIAIDDIKVAERITQALNFGFRTERNSEMEHVNGKLSEYHAAVGLAALDCWPETDARMIAVADAYRRELANTDLATRLLGTPDIGSSYVLFDGDSELESERIQRSLKRSHIDFRLWYGRGLHAHRYLSDLPRDTLKVTERIAPRLLGLPLAVDLPTEAVRRVVEALIRGSAQGHSE